MAKQRNGMTEQVEGGLKRTPYPYYSLQKCLEVAAAVRDCGGVRGDVPKSVLAHHMKIDESSAAFSQMIGSAKCFGMLQGWGTYALTATAKEFFFPSDEMQKRRALLQFLKAPVVFEQLIDRFDGTRIPSNDILANILHREFHVSRSWMPRVASLFMGSLRDAGAVDTGGFLRYSSVMHNRPAPSEVPDIVAAVEPSLLQLQNIAAPLHPGTPLPAGENVWVFKGKGGGVVRLETPSELSLELWDKLNRYVQVLKPEKESQ
jgi:hypothetical protein